MVSVLADQQMLMDCFVGKEGCQGQEGRDRRRFQERGQEGEEPSVREEPTQL